MLKSLLGRMGDKDLLINAKDTVGELKKTFEVNRSLIEKVSKPNCQAIELSPVLMDNAPELILRGINQSTNGLNYQIKRYRVSDEELIDAETNKIMVNKFREKYSTSSNKSVVSGFVLWVKTIETLPTHIKKIKLSLYYYQPANIFYLRFDNLDGLLLLNKSSESGGMASELPCPPFCNS